MSAAYIQVHFRLDFLWKRFKAKIMYPDQTREQSDLGSYCLHYRLPDHKLSTEDNKSRDFKWGNGQDNYGEGP